MRRRGISLADQGISSLSNFLLAVLVAQGASASTFGVYAIIASLYWFALGGTRALVGEPVLILREELRKEDPATDRGAVGASVTVGACLAVPLLAVGLVLDEMPFTVLGLALPALLWQDGLRYVFFARIRPQEALRADVVWLVGQSLLSVAYLRYGDPQLAGWLGIWGLSALLSAATASLRADVWPRIRGVSAWARKVATTSSQMFGDFLVTSGSTQLVVFLLPLVSSLSVLGALKAAQVAIGPLQIAMTAAIVVAIPSVNRLSRAGRGDLALRRGVAVAGLGFAAGCTYAVVVTLVPASWGEQVLGDSWREGDGVVGLIALQYAIIAVLQGATVVLRGTLQTRLALVVRLYVTPGNVLIPLLGAYLGGVRGLGIALAGSAALGAVMWWTATVRSPAVRRASGEEPGAGAVY